MEHEDIFTAVRDQLVAVVDCDAALVTPDARLNETLEADSVHLVEMAAAFERDFDVQIDDHELSDLETVADLVALIARKRA